MKEKYIPKYAEGEVLVKFHNNISVDENYATVFGEILGYILKSCYDTNMFIYETSPGSEKKAIRNFQRKRKFVECAFRRDILFDERYNKLDGIKSNLEELTDNVELPKSEFDKRINSIVENLKKVE